MMLGECSDGRIGPRGLCDRWSSGGPAEERVHFDCGKGTATASRACLVTLRRAVQIGPGWFRSLKSGGCPAEPGEVLTTSSSAGPPLLQRSNCQRVDLYLLYAATQVHVTRYLEYAQRMVEAGLASNEDIELWSDDVILSRTGLSRALIHDAGFLLQGITCYHSAIALHKQRQFEPSRWRVQEALDKLSVAAIGALRI